jgi:ABC-type oligopeptide transport system substrate-binding subunit
VGVRVEVGPVSIAELLNQHIYPRRYDLALLALNPGPTPSFLRAFYHSGGNRFGYRNAAVDELIDTLPVDWDEADPTAVAAVHDIQRRVDRDVPHTPLFYPEVIDVASTRLTLPPVDGLFINRFSDLPHWRVTEPAHGGNGERGDL